MPRESFKKIGTHSISMGRTYLSNLVKKAREIAQENSFVNLTKLTIFLMGLYPWVSRKEAEESAYIALKQLHEEGVGIYYPSLIKGGAPVFECLGNEKEED